MTVQFWLVIVVLVLERVIELALAKRNTAGLLRRGGVEFGATQYYFIVAIHVGFFAALILEFYDSAPRALPPYVSVAFVVIVLAQLLRLWVMVTMGARWTTRIIVVPGERFISRGPFRFLAHPIYVVVFLELLTIPFIFGLWLTALAFTLINSAMLLLVRIPEENRAIAWAESQNPNAFDA